MTTLIDMAHEAVRSARILFEAGDRRGAVNRAYYATFHAARSALNSIEEGLGDGKKHATTIRRFGQHLVMTGTLDARLSKILTAAFDSRLAADYEDDEITDPEAKTTILEAEELVCEIARFLKSRAP